MKSRHFIRVGFASIFTVLVLAGCSPDEPSLPPGANALHGAGSTFVWPLFKKWFEVYQLKHPDVAIKYDDVGSGQGTKRFLAGEVDFGASDAALTDEQMAGDKQGAVLVPVTAGIIVLAYNSEKLPDSLKLSREVYTGIFLGKITRWDDARIAALNPDVKFPALGIKLVVRRDPSGTTFAFTNHLAAASAEWKNGPGVGQSVTWPEDAMPENGNDGVALGVKQIPGGIGYVEYGVARIASLGMATMENKAGKYVRPSGGSGLETLMQTPMPPNLRVFIPDPDGEESYPIVTYSWLLLNRKSSDPKVAGALKPLVHWCLTNGQEYSESLGYLRLPPKVVRLAEEAADSIGQ